MPRPKKPIPEGFPKRLDSAMKARDMRPIDLAQASGVDATTISRYTSGTRSPTFELASMLSRVLGVSADWLYDGTGPGLESNGASEGLEAALSAYDWPSELEPEHAAIVVTRARQEFFKVKDASIPTTYWTKRITRLIAEVQGRAKDVRVLVTDADLTQESPEIQAGRKRPKKL